jgi:hypothetical protein
MERHSLAADVAGETSDAGGNVDDPALHERDAVETVATVKTKAVRSERTSRS